MKLFFLTFSLVFILYSGLAQNNEKQKIINLINLQKNAWNEGNIEEFMKPYLKSDSLKFIGKKGITYGWQQTLENYKKSYPDKASMGKLEFEIIDVEVFCNNAYVVGKWKLLRDENKGNLEGFFTMLMKKIKNQWMIVSDHSS